MTTRPDWMKGLDPDQIEFYQRLSPAQAACRGGRRHNFQLRELLTRAKLPRTLQLTPMVQGGYQITDHCARGCGRWIRYITLPSGGIDWDSAVYGGGGSNYHAKGLDLSAGDDRQFMQWLIDQKLADAIALLARGAAARKTGKTGTAATA